MPEQTSDNTGPRTVSAEERTAQREIHSGAQDAGVKLAGLTEVSEFEDSFAGSKSDPVNIGQKMTIRVRVAEDGTLLPRREDSGPDTPPATSILTVDVIPSVEFDSNGDGHVVWNGHASQVDVASTRVIASSLSGATRAEREALEGGRAESELRNDAEFRDGMLDHMATSRSEAVTQALAPLVSGGKMNIGAQEVTPGREPKPKRNPRRIAVVTAVPIVIAAGVIGFMSLGDSEPAAPGQTSTESTDLPSATPPNTETSAVATSAPAVTEPAETVPPETIPAATEPVAWSAEDPTGDWEEWGGFDPIDRSRERNGINAGDFQDAADLVGIDVSTAGGATEITVSHAGDAQAAQAADEGDYSQGITITLSDGTRWEVIFRDDGSVKIVSAPPGVSVKSRWITPEQVLFTLSGITIDTDSLIEATIFLEIFGGVMLDVLTLATSG